MIAHAENQDRIAETRPAAEVASEDRPRRSLYDLLQVTPTADSAVVEAAYGALLRLAEATGQTRRQGDLSRAHEVLSNPRRRAIYDLTLKEKAAAAGGPADRGQRVVRKTRCWRCERNLGLFTPYCSYCHWLVCQACGGCGCEHPDWKGRGSARRFTPEGFLGWLVAAVLAVALVALLAPRGGLL